MKGSPVRVRASALPESPSNTGVFAFEERAGLWRAGAWGRTWGTSRDSSSPPSAWSRDRREARRDQATLTVLLTLHRFITTWKQTGHRRLIASWRFGSISLPDDLDARVSRLPGVRYETKQ